MTLAPEVVEPLLEGRFGRPYVYRESCESTQALFAEDAAEGSAAVCEEQTAGRGRLDRKWFTPRGTALALSLILRPTAAEKPYLTRIVGLAALAQLRCGRSKVIGEAQRIGGFPRARGGQRAFHSARAAPTG